MNDSLDKLIGNDELLTYICLILAILNTFLMSIIINDIKHHFSIYIFSLFEALFLIFIIYFLLKKKDIYNKDYDIKYDWYFYLRISIITLVFFNFALYIYNISNFPPINPKKTGGAPNFIKKLLTNPFKKSKTLEELNKELEELNKESLIIQESLNKKTEELRKKEENNNSVDLSIIRERNEITKEAKKMQKPRVDIENIKNNIELKNENIARLLNEKKNIINDIKFLNNEIKKDTSKLKKNNNRCKDIDKKLRKLPAVAPAVAPAVPAVPAPVAATTVDVSVKNPLSKISKGDLKEFTEEENKYLLSNDDDDGGEDVLSKLQESINRIDKISPNDELKNLEKKEAKKEAKEQAKKEAKEKAKKEAKQIYKNIKKLVTKNNSSETDEPIKKAKDLAEEKATEQINKIRVKINKAKEKAKEAKEAKEDAKEAIDKGETKEERKIRINTERVAKNERYKDIILEKILIKSLKGKLLKNIE